jgi:hypothetical protein
VSGPLEHAPGMMLDYAVDLKKAKRPAPAIPYTAVRMWDNYLPREVMKADPNLVGAEFFRAPQMSNPTYFTPDETKRLATLLKAQVTTAEFRASKWARLL